MVAILCLVLSAVAVLPFYWMGQSLPGGRRWDLRMPVTHDMYLHFDQMRDFHQGLAAGEIYPRWEEDTNYGFGAPTTCFYPPGVYYLTSALYPWFRNWLRVLLAAHLLMMFASAAAMYWLARRSMSRMAAAVAMAAYIILPYHLADQYHREAIAELLAFIWMPLMVGFADELLEAPAPRSEFRHLARSALLAAGLGVAYGAFLWSHPPTAYQFTLVFVLLIPILAAMRQNWRGLLWIGGGLALGLGLSAAYLYPAAVEAHFIRHEVLQDIWPYHDTYLFMRAEYTRRYPHFFDLLDSTWWLGVLGSIPTALAFLALTPKEKVSGPRGRLRSNVAFWVALSCFASFMMLRQSEWFGNLIPKLDTGVFSWRMLAIPTLAAALLAGAAAQAALDAKRAREVIRSLVFVILVVAVLTGGALLSIFRVVAPVNAFPAFQPAEVHLNYAIIPRTAPASTDELPDMERAEIRGAAASVNIAEWMPQHRVVDAQTPQADPVLIRTFNYPGWTAALDGRPASIDTDNKTGAIIVNVPAGKHVIVLDFLDTPARRLGVWITLGTLLATLTVVAAGLAAYHPRSP
jgi:hypothetical protein